MFKCLKCSREFKNNNSLSRHIGTHMTQEEYFDKYLRTSEQEGKCVICGKPTRFRNFSYSTCCSQSCRNTWINQNRSEKERQELSKKISKAHRTEEVLAKTRYTNIERYGVPYTTQNSKVQEKRKQTCQEKYGTDCSFQTESVKKKIQQSIHEHYGEEGLDIDLENSGHYGSFVLDIDAEHDSLTLHIDMDGEEYFNATSYDNWDELDSDEQEDYENGAQKIVDQYSKTYPSIFIGILAVYEFLKEINEKDDEPLDDDSNKVLEKLFDIFPE